MKTWFAILQILVVAIIVAAATYMTADYIIRNQQVRSTEEKGVYSVTIMGQEYLYEE